MQNVGLEHTTTKTPFNISGMEYLFWKDRLGMFAEHIFSVLLLAIALDVNLMNILDQQEQAKVATSVATPCCKELRQKLSLQ